MKHLNKFSRLPQEDQTLVLNLCDKLPYHAVAETLGRPRSEGGLALTTSPSSLCKFYSKHHPEAVATEALGQFSAAIQVSHQAHSEANFEAILALVQNRLLAALREGKPLADLDRDFRNLHRVQKCFLADAKHREKNDHTHDAYLQHIKNMCLAHSADFIRNDIPADPGAGSLTAEDFQAEPTQYELDLELAERLPNTEAGGPEPTFFRNAARVVAALAAERRDKNYIAAYKLKTFRAAQRNSTPSPIEELNAALLKQAEQHPSTHPIPFPHQSEISSPPPSKSPAISHISPNFASSNPGDFTP
jgi:hypothetical protein